MAQGTAYFTISSTVLKTALYRHQEAVCHEHKPSSYWTLWTPTTTTTSELKAGLGLLKTMRQTLKTRGKRYGFGVGGKAELQG